MKFAAGITTALLAMGGASAFAPQSVNGARSSQLNVAATEPVYTFTKSEEIFAEAKEVRFIFDTVERFSILKERFLFLVVSSFWIEWKRKHKFIFELLIYFLIMS